MALGTIIPVLAALNAGAGLALGALGVIVLARAVDIRRRWTLRPPERDAASGAESRDLAPLDPAPLDLAPLDVVIPAHNEASVLPGLIAALRAQDHPDLRVTIALDRCTDASEEAAKRAIDNDPRFALVLNGACPAGWSGKVNALRVGYEHARAARAARAGDRAPALAPSPAPAPVVAFLDADTLPAPWCLRAAQVAMHARGAAMLSVLPELRTRRWFEFVAQPAAMLELARQHPLTRANSESGRRARRPFATGQFLMFRVADFEALGGHAPVKDELLEDLALARRVAEAGLPAAVLVAGGALSCAMYPSWASFRAGWRRIYTEAARRKVSRLTRAAWGAAGVGCALPLGVLAVSIVLLLTSPASTLALAGALAGLAGAALWLVGMGAAVRAGGAPAWTALVLPLGYGLVAGILRGAAGSLRRGEPIRWGGMAYVREAR